jgi:hypothetical protein
MERKAWMSAISPPASPATTIATTRTIHPGPPRLCETKKALTAPMSIIPSTPRLSTPERSASSSPRPARTSGVP